MINITLNHMPSVSSQSLNAVADQDTFYDVTDVLEEQGMEEVIKRHTDRKNGDLDLLEQFQIYEAVLRFEDGVSEDSEQPAFDSIRFVMHCSRDSHYMLTHYTCRYLMPRTCTRTCFMVLQKDSTQQKQERIAQEPTPLDRPTVERHRPPHAHDVNTSANTGSSQRSSDVRAASLGVQSAVPEALRATRVRRGAAVGWRTWSTGRRRSEVATTCTSGGERRNSSDGRAAGESM